MFGTVRVLRRVGIERLQHNEDRGRGLGIDDTIVGSNTISFRSRGLNFETDPLLTRIREFELTRQDLSRRSCSRKQRPNQSSEGLVTRAKKEKEQVIHGQHQ